MKNSRSIDDLRPDVAANCRTLLRIAKARGLPVLITGTVRDAEYQQLCYRNGTASTPVPSFHSVRAGLAFDICKNVRGHEYDDLRFFSDVADIARSIGFSWGGDWKSFPDRPHFQWDNGGSYSSAMIRAGKYPPSMPIYQEDTMTQEQFNVMMDNYLAGRAVAAPARWSAQAREWAERTALIAGDENGNMQYGAFVTREQLALILYRLAAQQEQK